MIIKSKEFFFGFAIIISSFINYLYIALLNSSFDKVSEFYLQQSMSIVLTSFFSLGLVNSILKFNKTNNLILALYASLLSILFSSIVLFYFFSLKAALLPIVIIVDLFFFYFRSIGSYINFFIAKISYSIIPLILFYYFKTDPYYLILLSATIIMICFFNKIKFDKISLTGFDVERKQIEYAWPISLNVVVRTFISYFDQIFFLVMLSQFDLDDYTKLIKLSMGFRLAFTLPHVRLLPLYLVDFGNKVKLVKLKRFYNYYIFLIFIILILTSKYIINLFSINEELIFLTLILITAELIRSASSFKQMYYSAINKTINNLYGNLFAFLIVIILFYPSYMYFGLNGLVCIQLISSLTLIFYHSWRIKKLKNQSVL